MHPVFDETRVFFCYVIWAFLIYRGNLPKQKTFKCLKGLCLVVFQYNRCASQKSHIIVWAGTTIHWAVLLTSRKCIFVQLFVSEFIQSMQVLVSSRIKEGRKILLVLLVLFSVTYIYFLAAIGRPRSEDEKSNSGISEQKYQKFLMRTLRQLNAPQVFFFFYL